MIGEFGEFDNFVKFMGHDGHVAMCMRCGALLHANLMPYYPHRNCFNCGDDFRVVPYSIAEGIWNIKKAGLDVLSWKIDGYDVEIDLNFTPENLPRGWDLKNNCYPNTSPNEFSKIIVFFSEEVTERDYTKSESFEEGICSFINWSKRICKNNEE